MIKKYLSALIIFVTLILVAFMIFDTNENDTYIMVNNQEGTNKIGLINENINELLIDIEKVEDKNIKEETIIEKKEENQKIEKRKEFKEEFIEENQKLEEIEDNNYESGVEESIFIVDKEQILKKLSTKDKFNLMKLSKEFSMNDYAIISESIKNNGEEECALEILGIVQKRLDKDDYMSLKGILEPYINIDLLEEKSL